MTMPDSKSEQEKELSRLVAEVIARDYLQDRRTAQKEADAVSKPVWLQLFESAGFAALITVLLGGLAGGWITYSFQNSQAKHALEQSAFEKHLERERSIVDESFLRLGKFADASRDLITLSRREYCEKCDHSGVRKRDASEKETVVRRYDDAMTGWNENRLRLGMLLQLEHDNDSTLLAQWTLISDQAETYAECADRWRTEHVSLEAYQALLGCKSFRDALEDTVDKFTQRLVLLRASSTEPSPAPKNEK
jgi:hypothetical protein